MAWTLPSAISRFVYWSDDGDLMALRMQQFKIVFAEQRSKGLDVWREPLSMMRIPKLFDLRSDPFERGEESFKEFPPRQKAASFTVDQIVEKLMPRS